MSINKLLVEKYFENHIEAAVNKLSLLTDSEILTIIKSLPNEKVYKIFSRLERYRVIKVFDQLEVKTVAEILNNISSNIALLIIRQMDPNNLKSVLTELPDKTAVRFTTMLQYDEYSVGAVMTTNIFTLTEDILIHDAIENIKRYDGKIPSQIFIVGHDQKLKGKVELHKLIRGNTKEELRTIIDHNVPKIFPQNNIKSLFDHKGWVDYYLLPVTDGDDLFLGVISLEVIRNIVERKSKKELKQFAAAGSALGELYRLGLSGLFHSTSEIASKSEVDQK